MNNFADSIASSTSDDDDSSDEDDLVVHTLLSSARNRVQQRGESSNTEKRHRILIVRDRMAAHELLVRDYFALDSFYEFFQLRWDARGKRGFSILQKCTATLRQLAYDIATDASDEYLKMSERTGRECAYLFCEYAIELYGDIYLRHPTRNDIEQLYAAK
ncbi:uncharacterized protein LOC111886914 [Lactuca sativa]|uniref:uncharacterized protein LOC111886914 n=1 Tax=Lactuca sativa TaxID=4236 RepID=UPI000CD8ABF8|nr:uncharacterized protein LOC111886914 [Lactuca sativa]